MADWIDLVTEWLQLQAFAIGLIVLWLIILSFRRPKSEVTWASDPASQNMKIVDEAFSDLERRVADLEKR